MQREKFDKEEIKFSAAAALSCLGDGVISTDMHGKILFINQKAEEIFGLKSKELLGTDFDEVFTVYRAEKKDPVPDSIHLFLTEAPDSPDLSDNAAPDLKVRDYIISKDQIRKSIAAKFSKVILDDGTVSGAVVVFRETADSGMRDAQNSPISGSRSYINNLHDQIPSMVMKTNADLEIIYVNKRWVDFTGIPNEKVTNQKWKSIIHSEDLDNCIKTHYEATQKRLPYQHDMRLRRYDGVYRRCMIIGTPCTDLDGQFDGYLGVICDMTDLKEAEEGSKRYELLSQNIRDIILFY